MMNLLIEGDSMSHLLTLMAEILHTSISVSGSVFTLFWSALFEENFHINFNFNQE